MVPVRRVAAAIRAIGGRAALGAAAIMMVACGAQHTSAPATASAAASSPAPHNSNSATAAGLVSLPNQLPGRNKNTSAVAKQAVSVLDRTYVSPLTADLHGTWKAALYGGGQNGETPFFFVVAGKLDKRIASPDSVAHRLQNSMVGRGITDAKVFPAGPGGEALVCARTHMDIICSWADHVSFGVVLYSPGFASSLNDGASKARQVRSAVVH
jgi:hypothetical protein